MSRLRSPWLLVVLGLVGCNNEDTTTGPQRIVFGSGNVVEEARAVNGFSALSMEAIGEVHLSQGAGESLRITAEDNLLASIVTEVRDGVLHIRVEDGVDLRPTKDIDYHLGMTTIESVVLAGAGTVEGTGITGGDLSVVLTGVGDVALSSLTADRLDVVVSGVGDVGLSGNVDVQTVTVSGLGDVDASDLVGRSCTATISGSGTVTVRVSDRLVGTISGLGWICYIGSPAVQSTVTGQGSVGPCGPPVPHPRRH